MEAVHTPSHFKTGIAAHPPEATITEIPRCFMRFETEVANTCRHQQERNGGEELGMRGCK